MKNIKTSTKALIIKDGSVLMIKKSSKRRQNVYTLPGGTQELRESLHRALLREVFEETGATINIVRLLKMNEREVRSKKNSKNVTRKIEYIFQCSIDDDYRAKMGGRPDSNQIGVRWVKISKLDRITLVSARLQTTLNELLLDAN